MDAARKRVLDEGKNMVESVDKEFLRKMQINMYRCSIKCCENPSTDIGDKEACFEVCAKPVHSANNFLQDQIQNFQDRLQRCTSDCADVAKDKATMNVTEEKIDRLKGELDECIIKCADSHIKLMPDMLKRIQIGLTKIQN